MVGRHPRPRPLQDTSAPQDDVAELLHLAAAGDQLAWSRLVERFSALLWSISRSHGLSAADAADVFQLTWLRLLEHLDSIEDPARLVGWLATTCRRECLSVLRRNKRTHPTDDDAVFDRFAGLAAGADRPVVVADRDAGLWRAFGRLDQRCQEVLRVLLLEPDDGRASYELAGVALGMPVGSLGPTRARCLAKLRKLLDAEGINNPLTDS
jgi:RNA polymerase sigma factor (sigma-70 family)